MLSSDERRSRVDREAKRTLESATHGAAQEIYSRLLLRARQAGRAGNYGIAAALSVRRGGQEMLLIGANAVAAGDPTAHAEMRALRLAVDLLAETPLHRSEALKRLLEAGDIVRRPTYQADGMTLYSTLEPCPMCTVALLNAGISHVFFAVEDPIAGALAEARLSRLAPLWSELARRRHLTVQRTQSSRPTDQETFVPTELAWALVDVFESNRVKIDARLADRSFFSPEDLFEANTH